MNKKIKKVLILSLTILFIITISTPSFAKKKKLSIYGFIWQTNTTPGIGYQVALFDKRTNRLLKVDKSNFFGKYKFKDVTPGNYIVRVGKLSRDITVIDKSLNEHFHLSSNDGKVDFYAAAQENSAKVDKMVAEAEVGPTDPQLMQWIAGEYYSYIGSTESKLMLCPGGVFYDSRESSYSGNFTDSGGNNTGSWGNASQNSGNGKWAINGTQQSGTITFSYKNGKKKKSNFKAIGDNCFIIGGVKYCYAGKAKCN